MCFGRGAERDACVLVFARSGSPLGGRTGNGAVARRRERAERCGVEAQTAVMWNAGASYVPARCPLGRAGGLTLRAGARLGRAAPSAQLSLLPERHLGRARCFAAGAAFRESSARRK